MESRSNKYYSVQEKDLNSSNSYCAQRQDLVTPRKLTKMTGCLEIIVGEDFGPAKSSQDSQRNNYSPETLNRPGSGSIGCVLSRPDSSLSRRVNTPTKQISLQAVRRKEENAEPFADKVDWQSLGLTSNNRKIWELAVNEAGKEPQKPLQHKEIYNLESVDDTCQKAPQLSLVKPSTTENENMSQKKILSESYSPKVSQEIEISSQGDRNKDDGQDDSGDDDSDSSEEEECEKMKAPNELLMEFVDCLMRKDFQTTSKLCKMILLYEPDNPEALKFQPLIEEKLALDAAAEKEEADEGVDGHHDDDSSDEEDDDDSSEEDDEDSSDSDDSSSSTSDEDDDDDQGGNASNDKNKNKTPSGQRHCHH